MPISLLDLATRSKQKDIVEYLLDKAEWSRWDLRECLEECVKSNWIDIARVIAPKGLCFINS